MQATWANLRLQDFGIFADVVIIMAGFSVYRGVKFFVRSISLEWMLDKYINYATQSTPFFR
jgi:hypothetical protein